jgi:hypothetical protein
MLDEVRRTIRNFLSTVLFRLRERKDIKTSGFSLSVKHGVLDRASDWGHGKKGLKMRHNRQFVRFFP